VADRIARRLRVLGGDAGRVVLPRRRFFTIGEPSEVPPYGEVLPLLSHVEGDLARYVLSTAPAASWGRLTPPPLVFSLPPREVARGDGLFLVTAAGVDRSEAHPSGRGRLHLVHLGQAAPIWNGPRRPWIFRLDAVQSA
jgi:hypothetical protein